MASVPQDLVGREVYSRDGTKLGEIKEYAYNGEYVVVRRSLFHKMVVPAGAFLASEDRLIIDHNAAYLEKAPSIDTKYELSQKDKDFLDAFYRPRAA